MIDLQAPRGGNQTEGKFAAKDAGEEPLEQTISDRPVKLLMFDFLRILTVRNTIDTTNTRMSYTQWITGNRSTTGSAERSTELGTIALCTVLEFNLILKTSRRRVPPPSRIPHFGQAVQGSIGTLFPRAKLTIGIAYRWAKWKVGIFYYEYDYCNYTIKKSDWRIEVKTFSNLVLRILYSYKVESLYRLAKDFRKRKGRAFLFKGIVFAATLGGKPVEEDAPSDE
ncbi:hypothetical protein B0H65DRAFT_541721 [Neurospora tetraspora]|uniref:Uncharacterized protein n=1 Tax=Neurospora tetraspora TaxID=94610 RepID=A0AAE0MP14_9PEZI|nr:hypothetical protein B0H65DRAFT_541721 [Neurospora tetraspora]